MAWKNGELFKLKKQEKRCYQACFAWDKYHWISTHENEESLARKWCEDYIISQGKADKYLGGKMTLGRFSAGFFSKEDPRGYRKRRELMGKALQDKDYNQREGFLENYILPEFSEIRLCDLSIVVIENWYIGIKSKSKDKLLSTGSRLHILTTLSIILDEAVRLNLIPFNPCDKVEKIRVTYKKKNIFTDEELRIMFPATPFELIRIWGNVQMALYFSIAIDTGWRAGEILALNSECFYEDINGIYSTSSVSTATGILKDTVKTTNTGGYKERVGFLSARSVELINMLPVKNRDGYFFSHNGLGEQFIDYMTLLRRLKYVLRDIVKIEDYYLYGIHNFRHTFMTKIKSHIDRETMLKLMGHTSFHKEYDHSTALQKLSEVENARDLIQHIV